MMRPAFSSPRQATALAVLLLILLLLPVLVGKSLLPSREEIYSSIWWANGAFPYIDQQIFTEKGDIDIAFVGPSHLWYGINTPYVQEKLSEKLGRPAVVRSICWGGSGYDSLYFITQDLLQNRKVRMVVFYDSYVENDRPNGEAPRWFRLGDNADALQGLSLRLKGCYYFASVIGMPRMLLSMVRSNLPTYPLFPLERNYSKAQNMAKIVASGLGSEGIREGFTSSAIAVPESFEDYTPQTTAKSSDVCVYSESTKGMFRFTSTLPSWQLYFARKFASLAGQHDCEFVLLHIPVLAEVKDTTIQEREFWPDVLHADITMMGIPSERLFSGLTDKDIHKLFKDRVHLNKNGQEYFTSIITPSLLQIYAAKTHD